MPHMKNQSFKIAGLLICMFSVLPAQAQNLIPWVGKALSKDAVSATITATAPKAFSGAVAGSLLRVMPNMKFVSPAKIYDFSQAPQGLSATEKALWEQPKSNGAQLGLAALIYDQNALLYKSMLENGETAVSVAEFEAHQKALAEVVATMQRQLTFNSSFTLRELIPHNFRGWEDILAKVDSGVDQIVIRRFFDGEPQPIFVVMTKSEMQTFAALPTLGLQRAYIEDSIGVAKDQLGRILSQDIAALSNEAKATYYLQKVRLDYFEQMQKLLSAATEKRNSLIMRYRIPLEEGMPPMTDAQRLGYVQYKLDMAGDYLEKASANKDVLRENLNKIIEFQEEASVRQGELRYMEELYGPYARAEVFGVPYEESFHRGAGSLLWSEDGEALARAPLGPELHAKISGRLNQAEQALQLMRKRVPTDLSFYADYYKLASLKKIYNSQLLCLPVSK